MPWSRFLSAGKKQLTQNCWKQRCLLHKDLEHISQGCSIQTGISIQLETNALIAVMNRAELNASAKPLSSGTAHDKGNEYFQDRMHSKNTNRILCACFYEEIIQSMYLTSLLLKWQHSSRLRFKEKCLDGKEILHKLLLIVQLTNSCTTEYKQFSRKKNQN